MRSAGRCSVRTSEFSDSRYSPPAVHRVRIGNERAGLGEVPREKRRIRRIRVRERLDQFLSDGTNPVRRDDIIRELDPAPPVDITGLRVVDGVLRGHRAKIAVLIAGVGSPITMVEPLRDRRPW